RRSSRVVLAASSRPSADSLYWHAGDRVKRLERRHVHVGKGRVGGGRAAVRRKLLRRLAPCQTFARLEARPALLVRRHEIDVEVQRLDLPDAVLADVRVLVDAVAPFGMLL